MMTSRDNGETLLSGVVVDQAVLHGAMGKIRGLGLPLLLVAQTDCPCAAKSYPGKAWAMSEMNHPSLRQGKTALLLQGEDQVGQAMRCAFPISHPSQAFRGSWSSTTDHPRGFLLGQPGNRESQTDGGSPLTTLATLELHGCTGKKMQV